ncbi:MAG: hypothetical protein HY079_11420 [Elusimicrobia bacterium]|nr:hypothetical protein [Elusimicrobiota bacterium]
MGLSFFDPRTGARAEFRPPAAPAVGLDAAGRAPREAVVAAALADALSFLGLAPRAGAEIRVGGDDPGPGAAWLQVGDAPGWPDDAALRARGFSPEDLRYLALKTHYRKPLAVSWDALAAARRERGDLAAAARALAGVSLEPSSRGRAGYLHRFREALSRDLDLPDALDCVWDALRPGALSPGSRAALLRETLPALGLSK